MKIFKKNYIALAAPSGGGKSTLSKMLLLKFPALSKNKSFTSRPPRRNEKNGVEYNFVSKAEFEDLIQRKVLVEYAEVHGNYYGTSREHLEQKIAAGKVNLLDVDVQGVDTFKAAFGAQCLSIFIMPPNMKVLEERLRGSSYDDEEKILRRLKDAVDEMAQAKKFDFQVVNNVLGTAYLELCKILEREVGFD